MKKRYIISIAILVVAIVIAGLFGYQYFLEYTKTRPITVQGIVIDNELVSCKSYDITHSFLNGTIKSERDYLNPKETMQIIVVKDKKLTIESDVDIEIKDTTSNVIVFKGTSNELQSFVFNSKGNFLVNAKQKYADEYGVGSVNYEFLLEVKENPQIEVSNEKPKQGELVKINVSGVFADSKVAVEGEFLPSNTFYNKEGIVEVYIPITYYKPAKSYEMKLQIDNITLPFTLDVQEEKYTQLHFTVDSSISNSTVNSAAANLEYRNKIHPLYKTMDSNKYWEGLFIKPIQEKRISSTFGQERYVNNAKTPTRHSGIDYAAPEGTEIFATNNGKVEFADFLQLTGNTIVIDHGLGVKSYHFHLSAIDVKAGEIVKKGQLIGKVGTTGFSTGPHLHFQMSIQNQPINPELMYQINY